MPDNKRKNEPEYLEKNRNSIIKADSVLLCQKHIDLDDIFSTYINLINPLIIQYEVLADEFPVEILNEIRSMFTHLSRCTINPTKEIVNINLSKAKSHAKRAVLDCYKYNCLAYSDFYHDFMDKYKNIDLTLIDNGNFLPQVTKKFYKAQALMIEAKEYEATHTASTDELYIKYRDSYLVYNEVYNLLCSTQEKADLFLNRLTQNEIKKSKFILIERIFAIIGAIGTLISLISFFI